VSLERRLSFDPQGKQMSIPSASVSGWWFDEMIGGTNKHDQSLAAFAFSLLQREENTIEKALALVIDTGQNSEILSVDNPAFAIKSHFEMFDDGLGKRIAVKTERTIFSGR
jgi:hypothetical protein